MVQWSPHALISDRISDSAPFLGRKLLKEVIDRGTTCDKRDESSSNPIVRKKIIEKSENILWVNINIQSPLCLTCILNSTSKDSRRTWNNIKKDSMIWDSMAQCKYCIHFSLLKSTGNFIESAYLTQSSSNINQQVALFQWLVFRDGEIYWEKHSISFSGCGLYLLIGNAHVFSERHRGLLRDWKQAGLPEVPDLRIFPSREKYKPVWTGSKLSGTPFLAAPLCWQPVWSEQPWDTWTL